MVGPSSSAGGAASSSPHQENAENGQGFPFSQEARGGDLTVCVTATSRNILLQARDICCCAAKALPILAYFLLPQAAHAQDPLYNDAPPNTNIFTPSAVPTGGVLPPQETNNTDDIDHESGWFYMSAWDDRGKAIRRGAGPLSTEYCLGNLSLALNTLGSLNAAEYSGEAGTLSLLPTAGALIGSPTKELWVVYKLMPLAGVLSMFLSLGGTMVPTQAGAYDPKVSFTYGGMMATEKSIAQKRRGMETEEQRKADQEKMEDEMNEEPEHGFLMQERTLENFEGVRKRKIQMTDAQRFASRVALRAKDDRGGSYRKVWMGVIIQMLLIVEILIALYYRQSGGVIPWWCDVWGWMWFWYFLVVLASIIENSAGVPFTHNWTMRINRAPQTVQVFTDAPKVQGRHGKDILAAIKDGFNVTSVVSIASHEAYTKQNSCFYVVISVEGVSAPHATFRVISKGSSVAVFAFGTTLFASASLMSVSVSLMVLSLVLSAGVFGRVTAMWIASQMNKTSDPVLHTVVAEHSEAAKARRGNPTAGRFDH